jgi:hypothetical protein
VLPDTDQFKPRAGIRGRWHFCAVRCFGRCDRHAAKASAKAPCGASLKDCSVLVDFRSHAPIGERVERVDRPWKALPLKCGQVGLSRAGRIDPD